MVDESVGTQIFWLVNQLVITCFDFKSNAETVFRLVNRLQKQYFVWNIGSHKTNTYTHSYTHTRYPQTQMPRVRFGLRSLFLLFRIGLLQYMGIKTLYLS